MPIEPLMLFDLAASSGCLLETPDCRARNMPVIPCNCLSFGEKPRATAKCLFSFSERVQVFFDGTSVGKRPFGLQMFL